MAINNQLPTVPVINGVSYTQADIILTIDGVPYIGCTAIDYSDAQTITPNYATGNEATSVGFGTVENAATITLTMETVQALTAVAPQRKIQNIPFFDVRVNFASTEGGVFISHRLVRCKFKGRNPNSAVDNSQIEEALELFVGTIKY